MIFSLNKTKVLLDKIQNLDLKSSTAMFLRMVVALSIAMQEIMCRRQRR